MKKSGIGIASAWQGSNYHFGVVDKSTVRVELARDLRLKIKTSAADIGQGSTEMVCLLASKVLGGFPIDKIDFFEPDTAVTPNSGSTGASRFTEVLGNATLKATRKLASSIKMVACEILDSCPEDIVLEGNSVHDSEGSSLNLYEIVEASNNMGISLSAVATHQPPPTEELDEMGQGYGINQFAYATYIAKVEVDTNTGEVQVLKVSTFIDGGKIIHQKGAEMQVDGGIVMGLGHALMEELKQRSGQVETNGLSTYLIPTVYDMPEEITYDFVNKPVPTNELGAKGLAEIVMVPIIPAITNAIFDAVGVRIKNLPATPERVLLGIQEKEGSEVEERFGG